MDFNSTSAIIQHTISYESLQLQTTRQKQYRNTGRLLANVCGLCLSTFYFGYSLAYLSCIPSTTLQFYFGVSLDNANVVTGYLTGFLPIGAIFGAAISPMLMKIISRKKFLLLFNVGALIIAGVIQINNLIVLYIVRLATGFVVGGFMAITPVYINEIVPVQIQGSFGAFTQLGVVFGIVFSYVLGVIFSVSGANANLAWRFIFSFTGITAIIQSFLLIFNFIPESPVSLVKQGKIQQAKSVVLMFHFPQFLDKVIAQSASKVEKRVDKQQQSQYQKSLLNLKTDQQTFKIPTIPIAMFIGFQLPFLLQMTGASVSAVQIGSIVAQYDPSLVLYAPLAADIIQFITTAISVLALSYFGRRTLLVIGTISIAFCNIIIGVAFLMVDLYNWQPGVYIALGFILFFMMIFGFTLGPVIWLYVPEVIPSKFVPFATCINWVSCSFTLIIAPVMIQAAGSPYPVFFMLGGYCLCFSIINYFTLVETKGLSLVQISKKMMA